MRTNHPTQHKSKTLGSKTRILLDILHTTHSLITAIKFSLVLHAKPLDDIILVALLVRWYQARGKLCQHDSVLEEERDLVELSRNVVLLVIGSNRADEVNDSHRGGRTTRNRDRVRRRFSAVRHLHIIKAA